MATLKELIDRHGMGSGQRYTVPKWIDFWFEPTELAHSSAIGLSSKSISGKLDAYALLSDGWEFIAKPVVVRWLWAGKPSSTEFTTPPISRYMYSEEEAMTAMGGGVTKLLWSRTEFDV